MKNPKRLKLWMKELLVKNGMEPNCWWYAKNELGKLTVVHKEAGEIMKIKY